MPNEQAYWVALAHHPKIGAMSFKKILARFKSPAQVWSVSRHRLIKEGLDARLIDAIEEAKTAIDPEKVMADLKRLDIGVITLSDKTYPPLLRQIADPPGVLFVRGTMLSDELSLAVVGSRRFTPYGRRVVETVVPSLVAHGLVIISGLALGIDSLAHHATLSAGGRTVAVIGSGLDKVYPPANHALAERIVAKGGALISEFPPGTRTYPSNFPVRNRIIAGLSLGTVVVEAAADSGTLLTARAALDYNREVFAVPGDIFRDTSAGTNNLLKMGAKLVTSPEDILIDLAIPRKREIRRARRVLAETKEEEALLKMLSADPVHIDRLIKASNLAVDAVGSTLILMEMKGKVKNVGGNQYVKVG